MSLIQELSDSHITASFDEAVSRGTPLNVSCCASGNWHALRSRFLAVSGQWLWLDYPTTRDADAMDVTVGMDLGVSFKLKHHKHICNVTVETVAEYTNGEGETFPAVRVGRPERMQRVQRRAYQRADVPRNRSVLATFSLGAPANRAANAANIWEGWVTNISAGGFEVRLSHHGAPDMEMGDLAYVSIMLGQEFKPIEVCAQFRQGHVDERGITHHGFQFVGLNETAQGRRMLLRIGQVVCDFNRHRSGRRRSA